MCIYSPSLPPIFFLHKTYRTMQTALHLLFRAEQCNLELRPHRNAQPVLGWPTAAPAALEASPGSAWTLPWPPTAPGVSPSPGTSLFPSCQSLRAKT